MGNAESSIRLTMARKDFGQEAGELNQDASQSNSRIQACIRVLPGNISLNLSLSSAMLAHLFHGGTQQLTQPEICSLTGVKPSAVWLTLNGLRGINAYQLDRGLGQLTYIFA